MYLAALIKLLGVTRLILSLAATLATVLTQAVHASLLPRVFHALFREGSRPRSPGRPAFRFFLQAHAAVGRGVRLLRRVVIHSELQSANLARDNNSWRKCGRAAPYQPVHDFDHRPLDGLSLRRRSMPLTRVAGFAITTLLIALPWMLRDYSALGTFSIKDNFGMTAYASNNDCAKPSLTASIANGCYDSHAAQYKRGGTARSSIGWEKLATTASARPIRSAGVRSHPGSFLRLTAARALEFWFPPAAAAPLYSTFAIWVTYHGPVRPWPHSVGPPQDSGVRLHSLGRRDLSH